MRLDCKSPWKGAIRSLEYLIQQLFLPEEVDRRCSYCPSSTFLRRVEIQENPTVLVIALKRFLWANNRSRKLSDFVSCPLQSFAFNNVTYNLAAVVNHHGSLSSGHYSATVLRDNTWIKFNDTAITRICGSRVISRESYILLYSR